ncbi:NAD(P)H-binding protein [Nocardia brasiliensis]|uniref:NAD(P)H-binding protein n=1 Tax=Nocardia brasiliensis TaxID=37326 RepID=UPI002455DF55|nr:NAD(P)H-binding protein [Nocardia brasiliensis]
MAKTLMRELYGDMRLMETIVRDSGLDWTFVRPARLTDAPPTGTCRVQDGENPVAVGNSRSPTWPGSSPPNWTRRSGFAEPLLSHSDRR